MPDNKKEQSGVIFSFHQAGSTMKITALCVQTLVEVSVIAPTSLSQADMQLLAFRKLQRMTQK